jgi:RimJ/RimL family protein N-acetyltransferase
MTRYNRDGFLLDTSEQYIITSKTDEILGSIWSFKSAQYFDAVEIGYHIFDYKNRGKGYASQALNLLHIYIFESKQINRIELRIATQNKPSQKVAIKLGFNLEGTKKEAAYSK